MLYHQVFSSFKHADLDVRVFRQPRSDDKARRSSSNNDIVEGLRCEFFHSAQGRLGAVRASDHSGRIRSKSTRLESMSWVDISVLLESSFHLYYKYYSEERTAFLSLIIATRYPSHRSPTGVLEALRARRTLHVPLMRIPTPQRLSHSFTRLVRGTYRYTVQVLGSIASSLYTVQCVIVRMLDQCWNSSYMCNHLLGFGFSSSLPLLSVPSVGSISSSSMCRRTVAS